VSPLETILLYAAAPVAVLALLAVMTLVRPSSGRGARYRSGGEWDHDPLWWMGNPRGSGVPEPTVGAGPAGAAPLRTARGGARGTW
jgi:hypothetical protein